MVIYKEKVNFLLFLVENTNLICNEMCFALELNNSIEEKNKLMLKKVLVSENYSGKPCVNSIKIQPKNTLSLEGIIEIL